ncbi:MAG TPA: MFS transporter [Thermomicrobiales bacterium]|nr:MFS transporter [Thermomicrobiales bacterium]
MAIRPRVNPRAQLDDAMRERPVDTAWHGRFLSAVAQHPVFRRLWFGALAASVGQWMQQVALGWLAIVMTNSPGFVGIVTFSAGLPFLVVSPFGGAMIDRVDRRRLMLACQVLAFLLATLLAIDVITAFVQPWHLPIAAFLNGSLQALLIPTQQSLVPALVPRESLTNAIGLMSAGQNMTRVVGPSVAGIVIGTIGVGPTFLAQAIAIAFSFILVLGIVLPPRGQRSASGRGVFHGIRLVASRPDLRSLFLLASIPTLFVFPYIGFLNVFARDILRIGAEGLGLLMAVSGCGAVVGSLLVAAAARSEGTGRLLLGMTVLYGLPIVGVALSRTLWVTLPMLFMAGMLGAAFMSGNNALVQHRVSDDVRGRVIGAYMLTWGLMPLGSLPMGMIADRIGTPVAVAGGAVISSVLAGILGLTSSAIRDV